MDFLIHNGSRDVETRSVRASRPTHRGLTQFVMNSSRRLLRGRPIQVSAEELEAHRAELMQKEAAGILYVTTLDGRVVDLRTYEVASPPPPVNPRPEPALDSVERDRNEGVAMNKHLDEPPPADFEMPVPPPPAALETPVEPTSGMTGLPPVGPEVLSDSSSSELSKGGKRKGGR